MWVFGYGSLVWRPDFPYQARVAAYVRGWTRRFWQGSTDHRGLPGAPGRVVTLLPGEPHERCFGMAYALDLDTVERVFGHLDHRERGGYVRRGVAIHFADAPPGAPPEAGTVYIATADNECYLGPADPDEIASQIARARGPSGDNHEYLLRLAAALRAMGAEDEHVFDLERRVQGLLGPAAGV